MMWVEFGFQIFVGILIFVGQWILIVVISLFVPYPLLIVSGTTLFATLISPMFSDPEHPINSSMGFAIGYGGTLDLYIYKHSFFTDPAFFIFLPITCGLVYSCSYWIPRWYRYLKNDFS